MNHDIFVMTSNKLYRNMEIDILRASCDRYMMMWLCKAFVMRSMLAAISGVYVWASKRRVYTERLRISACDE